MGFRLGRRDLGLSPSLGRGTDHGQLCPLRGNFLRRRDQRVSNHLGQDATGTYDDQARDGDQSDALVGPADSPDGGTDRDPLSCVRFAGVFGVLSRLASAFNRHDRCGRGSYAARNLLSPIGLRRCHREQLAMAGACGLGRLRGHRAVRLLLSRDARNAPHR